jgi:hypothetical protein
MVFFASFRRNFQRPKIIPAKDFYIQPHGEILIKYLKEGSPNEYNPIKCYILTTKNLNRSVTLLMLLDEG